MKKFLVDESGQGMVEYVLIVVLIALVVIGAISTFGTQLSAKYDDIVGQL